MLGPWTVIAFDPDSRATAYAVAEYDVDAECFRLMAAEGGGTPREPVAWQDVEGCLDLLADIIGDRNPADAVVVVETQRHGSTWAGSCEGLWRQRFHLEAACMLLGVRCEMVEPQTWMRAWVPDAFKRGAGKGAAKGLYREKGARLFGRKLAKNEDRCAAIGMAAYRVGLEGLELRPVEGRA